MAAEVPGVRKKRTPRSAVLDRRPEYERLGRWLREQREAQAMQQKPLSRQIGKPDQFLNKVEHGRQRIDLVEFLDLYHVLGLPSGLTVAELTKIASGRSSQADD